MLPPGAAVDVGPRPLHPLDLRRRGTPRVAPMRHFPFWPNVLRRRTRFSSRRAFRPDGLALHGLEPRALRSTAPGVGRAVEKATLTYPTPAGPSERLDVYIPPGPTPPGGRPVILAIHGGGWRRYSKAGYGHRIASA